MRRTFTLTTLHGQPAVTLCHDEDAEVYINGVLAFTSPGYSDTYAIFPISPESEATLHPGKNVIAIHVRHEDFEAHYADAGLVEIEWTPEEIKANQ
jgi:hypothetical protein